MPEREVDSPGLRARNSACRRLCLDIIRHVELALSLDTREILVWMTLEPGVRSFLASECLDIDRTVEQATTEPCLTLSCNWFKLHVAERG